MRRRAWVSVWQIGLLAAAVIVWEDLAARGRLDPLFFSRPSHIGARVADWFASGRIYQHIAVTAQETLLAFLAGAALGIVAGFLLARSPAVSRVLEPYIKIANALPRIALAPIFTLWFGLGILSKVAFGVTLVFFVVFFNTYQGVRDADRKILDNARMLGASERDLVRHVLLPSAMTWILSSLHTSVGLSLVGAVVGEYLGSARGLGYLIAQAEGVFDTTGVYAGMVVLSVFVLLIDALVTLIERRTLVWKPGLQPEVRGT
jgi:NitT/TauT family transport system permease protein